MAIDHHDNFTTKQLRPQLDPYGKETLTLVKCHNQEEQGTCHGSEKPTGI
jgi:hypothetical protein